MTAVEICLEDLAGVAVAERAGADRIELCADLSEGGITPSFGTVQQALTLVEALTVHVLIRPRPGDFIYSDDEKAAMVGDIRALRRLGASAGVRLGFVVGALTLGGEVDVPAVRELVAAADGHPTTFHKAFDEVADQEAALETLVTEGIGRILTSGGAPSAQQGADRLRSLVRQAGDRVGILAAGGIRPANAADLVRRTGVAEVHLRAPEPRSDGRHVTSREIVDAVLTEVGSAA